MALRSEELTSGNLAEVVAFFRESNPFAEHNWGWETGRFVDWRWGSNILREAEKPGWFSAHCRVYRDRGAIRAVSVAEYGREDECIITATEDPDPVRHVLDRLVEQHTDQEIGLSFEITDAAAWLTTIFLEAGLEEEVGTGHNWEYDLRSVSTSFSLPEGFTVESLSDGTVRDYRGIAECIQKAFNTHHDVESALRSLESNPMFRPELSVLARSPDGRVAAYCRGAVDPANGVCGIDPVCCHPDFHRMGLGQAVVRTCFRSQHDLGGRFCYIGSAPEPAPSTYLYRSLGPTRRTVNSVWSMRPRADNETVNGH